MKQLVKSVNELIEKISPKTKFLAFGFMLGFLSPYILRMLKKMISKMKTARKQQSALYVGVSLGGTNYNVAIGSPQYDRLGNLIDFIIKIQKDGRTSDSPQQTISQITQFLKKKLPKTLFGYDFIGIASFGPLCLDKSNFHGNITSTPKLGWQNTELLKIIKKNIPCRQILIDTDVNSAAFAQFKLGKHKCKQSLAYVTVGTGVGVGLITHQKTQHGLTHPQGGHIILKRFSKQYQNFYGTCPFHNDCLQGMVTNKSIASRLNIEYTSLHQLSDSQPIWQIIGYYLAQLCLNLTLLVSPEVIIIGGGIMNRKIIYKYIHKYFIQMLAKYVKHSLFTFQNVKEYIKEPTLGAEVGVKGGMILRYLQ